VNTTNQKPSNLIEVAFAQKKERALRQPMRTESHEGNITTVSHEGDTAKQKQMKASLYDNSKE
jgi:hypothetical protein